MGEPSGGHHLRGGGAGASEIAGLQAVSPSADDEEEVDGGEV